MKNVAIVVAVVLALVCSQACAQKKSDASTVSKATTSSAGSSSKSTGQSIERVVSKTSKGSKASNESPSESTSKLAGQSPSKSAVESAGDSAGDSAGGKPVPAKSKKSQSSDKAGRSSSQDELTDEEQKKIKSLMRQTLKPFIAAELTDEQRSRADELFGKAVKDYVVKRSRAMITDELQKKQTAAMKEAKSSSKSAREQVKTAFASAGFSDDQVKVFKATQASLNKAKREFAKSLSEEQIQSLPESLRDIISGNEK